MDRDKIVSGLMGISGYFFELYRTETNRELYDNYLDMSRIASDAAEILDQRGHWIIHNYRLGVDRYECSECRQRFGITTPHCPWCGNEMDDSVEERVDD